MESLFIRLSDDVSISIFKKSTLMTGFVVHGHILKRLYNNYLMHLFNENYS